MKENKILDKMLKKAKHVDSNLFQVDESKLVGTKNIEKFDALKGDLIYIKDKGEFYKQTPKFWLKYVKNEVMDVKNEDSKGLQEVIDHQNKMIKLLSKIIKKVKENEEDIKKLKDGKVVSSPPPKLENLGDMDDWI